MKNSDSYQILFKSEGVEWKIAQRGHNEGSWWAVRKGAKGEKSILWWSVIKEAKDEKSILLWAVRKAFSNDLLTRSVDLTVTIQAINEDKSLGKPMMIQL